MIRARVGVVGATGLVGTEMLRLLEQRDFPIEELRVYASARSEGRALPFAGGEVTCEVLRDGCFDGLDLVVVDVEDPLALEWAPRAVAAGARVVDNSAAFRMEPEVPLVVAEVNPDDLRVMPRGIASCPNCTTMVLVTALAPLHRAAGIERLVVSTYQSVSGAGQAGIDELDEQWSKRAGDAESLRRGGAIEGVVVPGQVWSKPIAGNVIPLAGSVREGGYTSEEWKLVHETRKILHDPAIAVSGIIVVQLGHAAMPLGMLRMSSGLTSAITSGMSGSMRNAAELSTTFAPAAAAIGAHSSAIGSSTSTITKSRPSNPFSVRTWQVISPPANGSLRPSERADA